MSWCGRVRLDSSWGGWNAANWYRISATGVGETSVTERCEVCND